MKRIIVTGGAGFLGSNLIKRLLIDNNEIICIDNLYTSSITNIKPFLDCDNFTFINHNVIEPYDFECDEIYNLACPASPVHYQKDPIFTVKTCFLGILNALEIAKKYNAKILQASTSEVYGDPIVSPQNESYRGNVNMIGIRSCYDEGKRIAETLLMDYHREYNTKIKIMRIFNTYGPNMDKDDGRVISNFVTQALLNRNITIYGQGKQTRSFCFVDDLIDGMIKLMNTKDDVTGPINIGNPDEFTIEYLSKLVISLIDTSSRIVYMPLPQDDPVQRRPDITLAKQILNYEPRINLYDGLLRTIDYFRGIL